MAKIAEMRVEVHVEGQTIAVVLAGDELEARTEYPRKVNFDAVAALVNTKLKPAMIVALAKLLQRALASSRPPPPRSDD